MLTKLIISNFKGLQHAEIDLGNPVVFVGPNDSGKTTALQALTLWRQGLSQWVHRRGETGPAKRPGVAVNREALTGVPVPSTRQLWTELVVRAATRDDQGRHAGTQNVRIQITVEGVGADGSAWRCGLEFDYANPESVYCRPLRIDEAGNDRMAVPSSALDMSIHLLSPMSGLTANELRIQPGAIDVRLGEGRTAEVLRNLCWQVIELSDGAKRWDVLSSRIEQLFGVCLERPRPVPHRGEIALTFRSRGGAELDLIASGRGMQQTLLLLAFLELHPGGAVLLDEPDAHMEILRQRNTYDLLSRAAVERGTQIIAATHSEVVLNEAAQRDDTVVAFVGTPHAMKNKAQLAKALKDIGFEDYYQAEITGLVIYLEGTTDLAILRALAEVCGHSAAQHLERPFVKYVGNVVSSARKHFHGLQEAKPDLIGFALFDRLQQGDVTRTAGKGQLQEVMWPRREIENYLLPTTTLIRFARDQAAATHEGLFKQGAIDDWSKVMSDAITQRVPPIALQDPDDSYWADTKISDALIGPVFQAVGEAPDATGHIRACFLRKKDYWHLATHLRRDEVHPDVIEVLDALAGCASRAKSMAQ